MVVPIGRSDLPPICPAPAPLLVSRGFVHLPETPRWPARKPSISNSPSPSCKPWWNAWKAASCRWEESLGAFEQGIRLTRECQTSLSQAEQKVQILLERDGELSEAPFDAEGDEA